MTLARLWLLGCALWGGCAVDPSGIPAREEEPDLGRADAQVADLGGQDMRPADLGHSDLGDLGNVDLGPRDLGPPDMGPPDMGPPDMGPPPFCAPTAGLVGCYTFEGPTPYADRSGSANDLVASAVTTGPGAIGQGAYLNAGSSLYANDSPSLDPSTGFSVELFAYLDLLPVAGRMGLLDKDAQFGFFVYPSGRVRCSGGGAVAEVVGLSAATWTHLACTHDGSTIRLYIDGVERATGAGGAPGNGSATLNLGEDSPGGGDQLGGRLDEIRIWTRTLPAGIVAASAARR